jgi:hypothetical protein
LGKDGQRSGEAEVDWCAEGSSLSELHAMPEGDVIRCYDALTRASPASGPEDYLAELHRRDTDRLATRI